MTQGRKPRRRTAAVPDAAPAGAPEAEMEGASSPTEPTSPVNPTIPPPTPEDGPPGSQLALHSFNEPDGTAEQIEVGDIERPDEFDEPQEPSDLLVSVSAQALAGDDEQEVDGDEEADDVGEWAYPEGAGESKSDDGEATARESREGATSEDAATAATADLRARPLGYEPQEAPRPDRPALQIRLARIHLRTGSMFTARAELEALAAREQLDTAAHLDLAEARWRTGDLQGAGEAAAAYLADGGNEALGFVISAEAFALANRQAEARRHSELAVERCPLSELDLVFAGMPRQASWPSGRWSSNGAEAAPAEPIAEAAPAEPIAEAAPAEPAGPEQPGAVAVASEPSGDEPPTPEIETQVASDEAGLSVHMTAAQVAPLPAAAESPRPAEARSVEAAAVAAPEDAGASAEVAAGRSFLDAGDPMMAALHFGVAIRLAPISAGAVLEAIGDREDLPLQLVRGDVLRLLGLEVDAGNTYLSVASALGAGKPAARQPEATPEATAPELAPEPMAEAISPEPAPEVTAPQPAPQAAPEPAPVSTPEPAPEAAPEPEPARPSRPAAEELPPLRWE